ncbi:MAG: BACON domain-containing protein, partial [Bacteroidales bacterium]|nr:BACON domain-containing protein [Bacteroidales bacterium]
MKKLIYVFAAMAAILSSCKKEEVKPTPTPTEDSFTLKSSAEVSVVAQASTEYIKFETNHSWTVSADAPWISLNPEKAEGAEAVQTVVVSIAANEVTEDRTATITFVAGKAGGKVTIKQAAKEKDPEPEIPGIKDAESFKAFAAAVAAGDYSAFKNESGEVDILNNIDFSGVTDWAGIESFDGIINGHDRYIKNLIT